MAAGKLHMQPCWDGRIGLDKVMAKVGLFHWEMGSGDCLVSGIFGLPRPQPLLAFPQVLSYNPQHVAIQPKNQRVLANLSDSRGV